MTIKRRYNKSICSQRLRPNETTYLLYINVLTIVKYLWFAIKNVTLISNWSYSLN